jgi:hypothetical protein
VLVETWRQARDVRSRCHKALNCQALGDGLDDPVAVGDLRDVAFEVAGVTRAADSGTKNAAGRPFRAVSRPLRAAVDVTSRSSDGICALARCAAMREPIRSGARNGDTADWLWHSLQLITGNARG